MGVIPFEKFSQRKKLQQEAQEDRLLSGIGESLYGLLDEEGKKNVERDMQLVRMKYFLDRLEGFGPTSETVTLRAKIAENHSLENLWQAVVESNKLKWASHPAYYRAVLDEILKRENGG